MEDNIKSLFKSLCSNVEESNYSFSMANDTDVADVPRPRKRGRPKGSIQNERSAKKPKTESSAAGKTQQVQKTPHKQQKGSSRTKKCGTCNACVRQPCGSCQSCRINIQFKGKLKLGQAECLNKRCEKPQRLDCSSIGQNNHASAMEALMEAQEEATSCPVKEINGQVYDLRCFICKKLPRPDTPNRSELYRHYSVYHFSGELLELFGSLTSCPIPGCSRNTATFSGKNMADHMGQVHNEVEQFLPLENRIPTAVSKRSIMKNNSFRFPEVPQLYDRKTRTVKAKQMPSLIVESFQVKMDIVVEPDRAAELDLERYAGQHGQCKICNTDPVALDQLIVHLLGEHSLSMDFVNPDEMIEYLCSIKYICLMEKRESEIELEEANKELKKMIATEKPSETMTKVTTVEKIKKKTDPHHGKHENNLSLVNEIQSYKENIKPICH